MVKTNQTLCDKHLNKTGILLAAMCPLMYLNNAYLYPYVYVQTRIQGQGYKKYNSIII